jgi:hypothetical protein
MSKSLPYKPVQMEYLAQEAISKTEDQASKNTRSPSVFDLRSSILMGRVLRVAELTSIEREQMYILLSQYFTKVSRYRFEQDLAEKEWVVLLTDTSHSGCSQSGPIKGFSTLMQLQSLLDDQPIIAFFSGDTIVHHNYWRETMLPRLWGRHVFGLAESIRDSSQNTKIYWFLISSGYKTYRFLPVFFREFYPNYKSPMPPFIKRVLDTLAQQKFLSEYDPIRGIIRFTEATPLRSGVAEITERQLKDPHVAFFLAANPGHICGDELACLTELTMENLTIAGQRMIGIR